MSLQHIHPLAASGFLSSNLYHRVRPSYSEAAVTFLLRKLGLLDVPLSGHAKVLELGAGTGKFTLTMQEVLRGKNVEIISSEPLLSMRETFREILPKVQIKEFSAEEIDLPDCTLHAVVAAQCFHWFANNDSLVQIHRVLRPEGMLGLIWNTRDHSIPWVKELDEEVIQPCYEQSNTPSHRSGSWQKTLDASKKFRLVGTDATFTNEQTFTVDEFMDRIMSISVVSVKSETDKEAVKNQIESLLRKHKAIERNNTVVLPYHFEMYWYAKDLPDCSVNAVVAAQSFHWFANNDSLFQIHRVLTPEGMLGLNWNTCDHSIPWVKELGEEVIQPCYEQSNTPYHKSCSWQKPLDVSRKFRLVGTDTTFTNEQTCTLDEYVDRIMSFSVFAAKSETDKEPVKDQIEFILRKHEAIQRNNSIVRPYHSEMYWYAKRE